MNCLNPIVLKSGICVPCGKCDLCHSDRRNEWSIRLAIHLASCDRMPLFITLTYDDQHLPYQCMDWKSVNHEHFTPLDFEECPEMSCYWSSICPTLVRSDVSKFLKAYKRKYFLKNEDFQYFGCGEYGGKFGRPHYHLLFFGDNELYELFFKSTELAQDRLRSVWNLGFVHIGVAGYDGIHYVTKYCLKESVSELHPLAVRPFTIASNGIGMNFLKSKNAESIRSRLEYLTKHKDTIFRRCPVIDVNDKDSIEDAISYLRRYVPKFEVILDDGRKVFLPRAIRKRLVGSFEHFKDNPLWLLNYLEQVKNSLDYYSQHLDYDQTHEVNMSYSRLLTRVEKIKKRLLEQKYQNSKFQQL